MKWIVLFLSSLVATAQPDQVSELSWSNGQNCYGTNFAGLQSYIIPKNYSFTNFLAGGGSKAVTFSISTGPVNGTELMLNATTGSNVYTPNNNFTGFDQFQYQVGFPRCNRAGSSGFVNITIVATNQSSCTYIYATNTSSHPICSGLINFTLGENCYATNQNWLFTVSDLSNSIPQSVWAYTAGNSREIWTPSVVNDPQLPGWVFFVAPITNCIPPGDVVIGALCPCTNVICAASLQFALIVPFRNTNDTRFFLPSANYHVSVAPTNGTMIVRPGGNHCYYSNYSLVANSDYCEFTDDNLSLRSTVNIYCTTDLYTNSNFAISQARGQNPPTFTVRALARDEITFGEVVVDVGYTNRFGVKDTISDSSCCGVGWNEVELTLPETNTLINGFLCLTNHL